MQDSEAAERKRYADRCRRVRKAKLVQACLIHNEMLKISDLAGQKL